MSRNKQSYQFYFRTSAERLSILTPNNNILPTKFIVSLSSSLNKKEKNTCLVHLQVKDST